MKKIEVDCGACMKATLDAQSPFLVHCVQHRIIGGPHEDTFDELFEEVTRARTKFPSNRFLVTALVEEVGELAQAILQKKSREEICKEALQVACVALRIYEEGDPVYDALTDADAKK